MKMYSYKFKHTGATAINDLHAEMPKTEKPIIILTNPQDYFTLMSHLEMDRWSQPTIIGVIGERGGTIYSRHQIFTVGEMSVKEALLSMKRKEWWRNNGFSH